MTSLIFALALLIVTSLVCGYWLDDLFNGCRAAVLSYCALAAIYEGSITAFTMPGLTAVILSYAAFFAICWLLKIWRSQFNQRKLASVHETYHHGDEANR